MPAFSNLLDACNAVGDIATDRGLGLLAAEDAILNGRTVRVDGQDLLHFGSCSALGLELDPRVVEGAVDAARRFGAQFSASRAFVSAPPYAELEERLGEITGGSVLVTPNTTLASFSALPSLIEEGDLVILDQQVHATVQLVVPLLQQIGARVEFIRHARLDQLEEHLFAFGNQEGRVWHLLDGVYSMHGDLAHMEALDWLRTHYAKLHLFIDDAHGMSWTGQHGRGHALGALRDRERVVVAVSLNKSFGAGGGALVFPDEATQRRVRQTAGPLLFSGPVQPPMLGAALASAEIHLSPEIEEKQAHLRSRIEYANQRARELQLPLLHAHDTVPIRFIGLGPQGASLAMAEGLRKRGLLPSCALFPAVPSHQTGIRFSLSCHHRINDIDQLLEEMADLLPAALAEGGTHRDQVDIDFGLQAAPASQASASAPSDPDPEAMKLHCLHENSVDAFPQGAWDRRLGTRGSFDAGALRDLESVFSTHQKPEHQWRFHYFEIRDDEEQVVLSTFFTESWMKDDIFAEKRISKEIENRRREDPFFLTSRALSMGTPLTEGDALWIDRESPVWREALALLVSRVSEIAAEGRLDLVAFRDLQRGDEELGVELQKLGFSSVQAPPTLEIEITWSSPEEFLAGRSKRARKFHRQEVEPHAASFEARFPLSSKSELPGGYWERIWALYESVWGRSLELNTFPLPENFFQDLLRADQAETGSRWELLALHRRTAERVEPLPEAFFLARVGPDTYSPVIVGFEEEATLHGAYRQCLAWMLRRAETHGIRRVPLGMGASLEKRRFAAEATERAIWVQVRDTYSSQVLAMLARGDTADDTDDSQDTPRRVAAGRD